MIRRYCDHGRAFGIVGCRSPIYAAIWTPPRKRDSCRQRATSWLFCWISTCSKKPRTNWPTSSITAPISLTFQSWAFSIFFIRATRLDANSSDRQPCDTSHEVSDSFRGVRAMGLRQPAASDFTILGDHDIYLFNEGSHFRLYEKLGART